MKEVYFSFFITIDLQYLLQNRITTYTPKKVKKLRKISTITKFLRWFSFSDRMLFLSQEILSCGRNWDGRYIHFWDKVREFHQRFHSKMVARLTVNIPHWVQYLSLFLCYVCISSPLWWDKHTLACLVLFVYRGKCRQYITVW